MVAGAVANVPEGVVKTMFCEAELTATCTFAEFADQQALAPWLNVRTTLEVLAPVTVRYWGGKHAGPVPAPTPVILPGPPPKVKQSGAALEVVLELTATSGIGVVV